MGASDHDGPVLRRSPVPGFDLDRLYAAIDDDEALRTLPDVVAEACGGRSAAVLHEIAGETAPVQLATYWPAESYARYMAEFTEQDPWTKLHLRHAGWNGAPLLLDEILPPEQFKRSTIYNELFAPLGDDTARGLVLVLRRGNARFHIGVHRGAGGKPFGEVEAAALAVARDHVARVLRLRQLLDRERTAGRQIEAMLDTSDRAMLLVDGRLRIARATAPAIAMLDGNDGLGCRGGRLIVRDPTAAACLKQLVGATVSDRPANRMTMLCARPSGAAPYRLRVLPPGRRAPGHALLLVDDPERDARNSIRTFAGAYGLTPAECAIAEGLVAGLTVEEIAAERKVTRETIRTQLKMLFARTGVARQSEFVRLFSTLPGP